MQAPSHLATLRSNIDAYNQQDRFETLPYYKTHIEQTLKVINDSNETFEYGVVRDILQDLNEIDYHLCRKFKKNVVHIEEKGGHPLIYYPEGPFKVAHRDFRPKNVAGQFLNVIPSVTVDFEPQPLGFTRSTEIEECLKNQYFILNHFSSQKFSASHRMELSKKIGRCFADEYKRLVRNLQAFNDQKIPQSSLRDEIRSVRVMLKPITDFIGAMTNLDIQFDIILQMMERPLCFYEFILYDELLEILKANEENDDFFANNYLNRLKNFIFLCETFEDPTLKIELLLSLFTRLRWGHKEFTHSAKKIYYALEKCLIPRDLKVLSYRICLRTVLGKSLRILAIINKPLADEKKSHQNADINNNVNLLIESLQILFPKLTSSALKNEVKDKPSLKKLEARLHQLESRLNKAQHDKKLL